MEQIEFSSFPSSGTIALQYIHCFDLKLNDILTLSVLLQIHYQKLDGMKCLRVISKSQPITLDRKVAEEKANIAVLGLHAVQKSAQMASKGK